MISGAKLLQKCGGSSDTFLKGTDLPKSQRTITVKVTKVREPGEGFLSPLILDIEEINGKTAIPINKSNLKRLIEAVGDDLETLVGKKIVFEKMLVNNPKTNKPTYGLVVNEVKKR